MIINKSKFVQDRLYYTTPNKDTTFRFIRYTSDKTRVLMEYVCGRNVYFPTEERYCGFNTDDWWCDFKFGR